MAAAQPDSGAAAPGRGASLPTPRAAPGEPATLDPALTADPALLDVLGNLMEGLVAPGGTPDAAGGAPERWESADGREFTFYLRPDTAVERRQAGDGPRLCPPACGLHLLDPEVGAVNAHLLYEIAGAEAYSGLDPAAPDFAEQAAGLREGVGRWRRWTTAAFR